MRNHPFALGPFSLGRAGNESETADPRMKLGGIPFLYWSNERRDAFSAPSDTITSGICG